MSDDFIFITQGWVYTRAFYDSLSLYLSLTAPEWESPWNRGSVKTSFIHVVSPLKKWKRIKMFTITYTRFFFPLQKFKQYNQVIISQTGNPQREMDGPFTKWNVFPIILRKCTRTGSFQEHSVVSVQRFFSSFEITAWRYMDVGKNERAEHRTITPFWEIINRDKMAWKKYCNLWQLLLPSSFRNLLSTNVNRRTVCSFVRLVTHWITHPLSR